MSTERTDKDFERHPFFHSRGQVGTREAYFVRGPDEPRPSTIGLFLVRRGALFVHCPDLGPDRQWYVTHYVVETMSTTPSRAVERVWIRKEVDAINKALEVLGG